VIINSINTMATKCLSRREANSSYEFAPGRVGGIAGGVWESNV
jgi:hypothetical protein